MENSFKVGDKVKILPKNVSQEYWPTYVDGMIEYAGQLATIIRIINPNHYKINLDNGSHIWSHEILQLVTSETDKLIDINELKNGDYIKLTSTLGKRLSLIYLFRKVKDNIIYRHASYSPSNNSIDIDPNKHWSFNNTTKITYATEEERKLLDNALIKEGYVWNEITKQLDSIISLTDTSLTSISFQPVDYSSFKNCIQCDMRTGTSDYIKEEKQTEAELNLFPKKKHYQLDFNY